MHSTIYELTQAKLEREDWATDENFYDDNHIDYSTRLSESEREDCIRDLHELTWFKRLFSVGDSSDTIVYNGRIDEIKEEWYVDIQTELDSMTQNKQSESYRLRRIINSVIFGDTLFCLPEWSGDAASYPGELMEWLDTMEAGTVIHINAVFDYHW